MCKKPTQKESLNRRYLNMYCRTCPFEPQSYTSWKIINMDFEANFEDLSNDTIIANENHHNISFEAGELELNTIQWVIILIFWILLQTLGNGLLVGMIVYERVGNGDPLKRRIIDQVCFDFESFIYDEKTLKKS